MSECTCVGCRKNPSLPSNNSKSRKALENNQQFWAEKKADGFQDTTVNVGKCDPSWAPVAASPFRHGAFRPSNLRVNLHFPPTPRVPNDDSFRPSICPMPMWCPAVLTWWYGRGNLRVPRSRWVPQRVDDDEWPEVWTRDPARMASEEERKTQQEIAQQAAVAAAQKGSSSVTWPDKKLMGRRDGGWVMLFSKIWWMLAVRMLYLWCLRNIFDTWFLEGWGSRPSYQKIGPLKNSGANGRRDWYRQNAWYGG